MLGSMSLFFDRVAHHAAGAQTQLAVGRMRSNAAEAHV